MIVTAIHCEFQKLRGLADSPWIGVAEVVLLRFGVLVPAGGVGVVLYDATPASQQNNGG